MSRRLLYLTRHGEQDPDRPDGGLSDRGRQQAELLGQRLSGTGISRIHHSPFVRAVETADIAARYLPGVDRHACDLVTDRTPVPSAEHRGEYPNVLLPWLDGVPDEERDEDALALRHSFELFDAGDGAEPVELVVTHNFVIGWFVRQVLDAPTRKWMDLHQDNCAITAIRWDTDRGPALVSFNDTGHLRQAGR